MPNAAVARKPIIIVTGDNHPRQCSAVRPIASAPRTSLIDAEWDSPELAPRASEQRTTLPFPIFVPPVAVAAAASSLRFSPPTSHSAAAITASRPRARWIVLAGAAVSAALALVSLQLRSVLTSHQPAPVESGRSTLTAALRTANLDSALRSPTTDRMPTAGAVTTSPPTQAVLGLEAPTDFRRIKPPKRSRSQPMRRRVGRRTDNPY